MIKVNAGDVVEKRPDGTVRDCEIRIVGRYDQITAEYEALSKVFIKQTITNAPDGCAMNVANDLVGIIQSLTEYLGEIIIKEVKNA